MFSPDGLAASDTLSPPDVCGAGVDEVSLLTAVTLFLLSASSELIGVSVLQKGCIERFRHGLGSEDPWVSYTRTQTENFFCKVSHCRVLLQ